MNLTDGYATLSRKLKELKQGWEETRSGWNDPVGQSFNDEHWEPLEAKVVAALRAIDRLAPLLHKMKHECE